MKQRTFTNKPKREMKENKLCSEADCYKNVDLDPLCGDVVYLISGEIYVPSLKCWDCRTENDRKKIKRKRKEVRKQLRTKELN